MDKATEVPHLTDLNKKATLTQLNKELEILRKYRQYGTFENAIERLGLQITRIEEE